MGVRIPRLTIAADYDDESAFGDLSLLSLGYGLHQAWIYATMFGGESVFGIEPIASGIYGTHISLAFLVSIVVFGLCLLLSAATDQKLLGIYVSKKTLAIGTALMCLGSLILLAPLPNYPMAHVVFESVSGVMTGAGSALLIIFWGVAFARCDGASIVLNTAVAIVIGFGLYAFVLKELPSPISGILTSLIPLGECYILLGKTPQPYFERREIPIFKPLPVNKSKFIVRFGAPVFVFGLALGILRQTSIQTILPAASLADQALILLAAGCATVLILITILALNGAKKWDRLFRPLIPFVAIAAFFLPMAATNNLAVSSFVSLIAYMCFEALMWIFFGELSQRFRLSPVLVFGLGRGFLALAALAGSLVPVFATHWAESLVFGENTIVLAALAAMVIAYALLPSEREIEATVIPCPLVRTVSDHLEQQVAPVSSPISRTTSPSASKGADTDRNSRADEGRRQALAGISLAAGDLAPDVFAANVLATNAPAPLAQEASSSPATASHAHSPAFDSPAEQAPSPTSDSASATAVSEESRSATRDPHEANAEYGCLPAGSAAPSATADAKSENAEKNAIELPVSEARAAMYGKRSESNPEEKKHAGRFRMKCEAVANTFLLSRRETEVMFLLAKGRNSACIQEQLYISEGTAKTHIRHIYRKLDVHTQQELIRLVESIEVSPR